MMSRVHVGVCPALEDLLLAEDGELPPQVQVAVATHLTKCVSCQSEREARAGMLRMIEHVTNQFGDSESGQDPAAKARYQRFLVSLHERKQQRIHTTPTGWPIRRWLAIAALPLFVATLLVFEPHAAIIEADELVTRATEAESSRPAGTTQRVHIRHTPSSSFAMSVVAAPFTDDRIMIDGIVITTAATKSDGHVASIAQLLADHRFHWERLLNAADFNTWRSALAHKHDEVTLVRGTPVLLKLRTTTTDDGDLREVEITVERDTYRVTHESFVFETMGTLDFDQTATSVRRATPEPAPDASTVANVTAKPVRPAPERVSPLGTLPTSRQPDLSRWLDRRFGNSSARAEFMPTLRRLTASIRQRLDSLQDLSSRYPGSDGPQASPAARARLQRELDLQYRSLREDLDGLYASMLTLTLPPNGVSSRPMAPALRQPHAPEDWSRRVDAALPQASSLDRLAGELRRYDDLPDPVRERLASTFDALWSAIYAPQP